MARCAEVGRANGSIRDADAERHKPCEHRNCSDAEHEHLRNHRQPDAEHGTHHAHHGNGHVSLPTTAGALMVCPCCVQGPQCCCVGNNVTVVQSAQDCTGNIAAVPSTAIAINKISFAVDWDGLTAVTGEWFPQGGGLYGAGSYAEGGASFSCQVPLASEPFDASSRSFNANFFGSTQSGFGQPNCASFDANLSFFFTGTYPSTGFYVIAQNFSGVTLSLCRKQATIALDSNYYAWCSSPFSNSFTVEMIIAP